MKYLFVALCLFLASCANDPNDLNRKYVKDAEGNVYLVKAKVFDTYFLSFVDITELNRLQEFVDEGSKE